MPDLGPANSRNQVKGAAPVSSAANTDRELWRKGDGDGNGMSYYEPSIHVTGRGCIGINVGGMVFVRSVEDWHRLAVNHERYQRAVRRIFGLLSSRRWWNDNVWAAREIAKDVLLGGDADAD